MAGASMKAIKSRIKSVESTMQITKAMELVAASKLRRAKQQEEITKPFYRMLAQTIGGIVRSGRGVRNPFLTERNGTLPVCYIVIAGDRGLAGGYNNNLFRLVAASLREGDVILPIGKKSLEHYLHSGYRVLTESFPVTANVGIPESFELGKVVCDAFSAGRIGGAVLAYTEFLNMLSQEPRMQPLLPLNADTFRTVPSEDGVGNAAALSEDTVYEPGPDAVLRKIVPQYVSGMVYGAVCEAFASECAARRNSMSAANKNAGEMIDSLTLRFNRARQGMITQEITEIVAGADQS